MQENKDRKNGVPHIEGESRCPKCLSIKRSRYSSKIKRDICGVLPDGTEYDSITWRRTNCLSCKQARVERFYNPVKGAESSHDADDPFWIEP